MSDLIEVKLHEGRLCLSAPGTHQIAVRSVHQPPGVWNDPSDAVVLDMDLLPAQVRVFHTPRGLKGPAPLGGAETRPPEVHDLKASENSFSAVWNGQKLHELRHNDRGYAVGDLLILREGEIAGTGLDGNLWDYTGRYLAAEVTHITRCERWMVAPGVAGASNYVVLSIKVLSKGRLP